MVLPLFYLNITLGWGGCILLIVGDFITGPEPIFKPARKHDSDYLEQIEYRHGQHGVGWGKWTMGCNTCQHCRPFK